MPISRTEDLVKLVRSLTKAEKRNFRLYATRIQSPDDLMYLDLFDAIDKSNATADHEILKRLPGLRKSQYSNLKRHLYTQLLVSLRLLQKNKQISIRIREQIDFALVLYGKGLYLQSLKLLTKAKSLAEQIHNEFMQLTIVEIEKVIESRHITRSGESRAFSLMETSGYLQEKVNDYIQLSNLRIHLHGIYLRQGHVHNDEDRAYVKTVFKDYIEKIRENRLGLMHRVYRFQCLVWYYYILEDYDRCAANAKKWIELFESNPELQLRDVDLYLRGYHYLLTAYYYLQENERYDRHLAALELYRKENYKRFNSNSKIISFLYTHTGRLNQCFLHREYSKGLQLIPRTLRRIRLYRDQLDAHRILVFYYKIAWMYLGAGDAANCVKFLTRIIQLDTKSLREDIQCYARLMLIMAHYDLENYDLLDYLIKQTKRFMNSVKSPDPIYDTYIELFAKLIKTPFQARGKILSEFRTRFAPDDYASSRSRIYLDIVSWIDAKISGTTIEKIEI